MMVAAQGFESRWWSNCPQKGADPNMLLNVYFGAWLVTTIGALVVATRLSDRRRPGLLCRGLVAVLAGALWPVLVVGVVELLAIVAVMKMIRAASARPSDQAPKEQDDALICV